MTNPISFLFDWLLGLTRPGADPADVRAFVANPTQAASQAMGTAVTQAQLTQAASAVVAPAAVYGGGNAVQALQHTVADNNGLTFAPQRTFAPETDFASHNDTALASGNDIGSPRAGEDVQQGVGNFDLDFGDFTFGDKNTASDGSVVNTGARRRRQHQRQGRRQHRRRRQRRQQHRRCARGTGLQRQRRRHRQRHR